MSLSGQRIWCPYGLARSEGLEPSLVVLETTALPVELKAHEKTAYPAVDGLISDCCSLLGFLFLFTFSLSLSL